MKTIWKFPLGMSVSWSIDCPVGAEILYVADQPGAGPCVWALVDPDAPRERRDIAMSGTGHPVPDGKYIGSIQMLSGGGVYVWHYFDQGPVTG